MQTLKLITGLALACTYTLTFADKGSDRNFQVSFNDCKEYVAFGPISLAKAQAILPDGYIASDIDGNGGIVVRTSVCAEVSVDGAPPQPAIVAHYGINIESLDGSGDINNYTLVYVTDHPQLAGKIRRIGLPAIYSAYIAAEDPVTRPGSVYISIFGIGLIPYSLTGNVNDPIEPAFQFLANWWFEGRFGTLKQATNFASIAFGPANLVLQTTTPSALGQLIAGNTDSNFPVYNIRGVYAMAIMDVTLE